MRLLLIAAVALQAAASTPPSPLTLQEVLRSAEQSHPLLLATIQERAVAEGRVLSARGAFDTKLSAGWNTDQFGYYKNRAGGAKLEQPLRSLGGEIFGGYKRGQGNYGPWDQDRLTLSGGEWSGGVSLPLLRNREIDERRTELMLSRLAVELANTSIDLQRLKILEASAKSYWYWVSAGQTLSIAEALLQLAEQRNRQVEESVEAGQIAAIEITDNQRAVFDRRSAVVTAERGFQNASFELSLFYRDSGGQPLVASRERVPEFPEPEAVLGAQMESDLKRALQQRPEVVGTLVELRGLDASLRLARNQKLPEIDVIARYSRDMGEGSITKQGDEFEAGFVFESPFQRRNAKGKIAMTQAKAEQLKLKLRLAQNQITVQVRDARAELSAALQRLDLARSELVAAQQLAAAERERFELGDSSLFVVNIRELSAASARLKVVKSLAGCHEALAVYRSITLSW